jgi:hypothetical protein
MSDNNLNVDDIIKAQERSIKWIDKNKNCNTCIHIKSIKCDKCFNSFLGIQFNPSEWEDK